MVKIDLKHVAIVGTSFFLIVLVMMSMTGQFSANIAGFQIGGDTDPSASPSAYAPGVTPPPATAYSKPIRFSFTNELNGTAFSGATLALYYSNDLPAESLTTTSTGIANTTQFYQSGTSMYVIASLDNVVTKCYEFNVPSNYQSDGSNEFFLVPITSRGVGTADITMTYGQNTAFTDSVSIMNFTELGANSVTLKFTVTNTGGINTGWVGSYDQLNNVQQNLGIVISTTGSSVSTATQAGTEQLTRGTSTYWVSQANQEEFTYKQLTSTAQPTGGSVTYTVTFNKGALTAGSSQNCTLSFYSYFDNGYFRTNGVGGPNSAALDTFNFAFAA